MGPIIWPSELNTCVVLPDKDPALGFPPVQSPKYGGPSAAPISSLETGGAKSKQIIKKKLKVEHSCKEHSLCF